MATKLWAGRYREELDDVALRYTASVDADLRLIDADLWASAAHLLMLRNTGIIDRSAAARIAAGLLRLWQRAVDDDFRLDPRLEDVHLNVESALIADLGEDDGGRLHTARSRNDLVVTDTRVVVRGALLAIVQALAALTETFCERSSSEASTLMPGYTHQQPAQPITFGFWCAAQAAALTRDGDRLLRALQSVNQSPLGACALAGTSFPIDRRLTAHYLGFDSICESALDATSARDFLVDVGAALATTMTSISRFCADLMLLSMPEIGVVRVPDSFVTGSSIMPQKRNAVVAELARARAASVHATLVQLLSMTKGLPMGYSCDLQEDKPLVWSALDITLETLVACREMILRTTVDAQRGEELCRRSYLFTTEMANHLVTAKGIAFRAAHRLVGEAITVAEQNGRGTPEGVAAALAARGVVIADTELARLASPAEIVCAYTSEGGTAPEAVRRTIGVLRARLSAMTTDVAALAAKVGTRRAHTWEHLLLAANNDVVPEPMGTAGRIG